MTLLLVSVAYSDMLIGIVTGILPWLLHMSTPQLMMCIACTVSGKKLVQITWNQVKHIVFIANVPHFNSNKFAHYRLESFVFACSENSCFPHCLKRHLLACGSLQCTKYSAALSEPRRDGDSIVSAFGKKKKCSQEALIANLSLLNCVNGRCTLI